MGQVKKAKIDTKPVADNYARPQEKIIGFRFPSGDGGLISFDADLRRVEVYRTDEGVTVAPDHGEQAITALYDAADRRNMRDELDILMVAAGLRWRCMDMTLGIACGGINVAKDVECELCGKSKPGQKETNDRK